MQKDQFGQASLENDPILLKNIILGLNDFSIDPLTYLKPWLPKELPHEIQVLYIDEAMGMGHISLSPDLDKLTLNKPKENRENLKRLKRLFSDEGLEIKAFNRETVHLEDISEESLLFDILCLGEEFITESNAGYNDFMLNVKCSVFVYPRREMKVDHILLLFDGTPSSLTVMKSALSFFGRTIGSATISLLALHKPREKQFYREHLLVKFLMSRFPDVGVLAIQRDLLEAQVKRLLKVQPNTLLVSGRYAASLILNGSLKEEIKEGRVPFYFSS